MTLLTLVYNDFNINLMTLFSSVYNMILLSTVYGFINLSL